MTLNIDPGAVQSAIASISAIEARGAASAVSESLTPEQGAMPASESPSGVALTKKGEAYAAAALAEADGVFFITLAKGDRASVAYTIERLIDMLDAMETDPDLEDGADDEPILGAPERHPSGYGWGRETWAARFEHSQDKWAAGDRAADDREEECEDEGAQCEDEGADTGDREYSLGWTDAFDQSRLLGYGELGEDGEPDLGFVGHGTGWREGEDTADTEADQLGDDEREEDGDEGD